MGSLAADSRSEGTQRPRLGPNRRISLQKGFKVALVTMFMNNPGQGAVDPLVVTQSGVEIGPGHS